jgi:hypothetical protein
VFVSRYKLFGRVQYRTAVPQKLYRKYVNDKFTHDVMNNEIYRHADCETEDVEEF